MTANFTAFSVNVFYNRQSSGSVLQGRSKIAKRCEKTYTSARECNNKTSTLHKWPKPFCPRLLGPTHCWKTFYKQSDAFEFARQYSEDIHIFAFECATDPTLNKGQRKYLATSLPVFWHYYSQLPDEKKTHYEIIPEESACKLYFDLEFLVEYNSSSQGKKMTDIFIKYVCSWIWVCFGLDIDRRNILDLDSSTFTKFSRHLIFQLPGAVFEHNVAAGKFVHHIMAALVCHIEKHSSMPLDASAVAAPSASTSSCTAEDSHININHPITHGDDVYSSSSEAEMESCNQDQSFHSVASDGSAVVFDDFFNGKDDNLCLLGGSFSNKVDESGTLFSSSAQTSSSESPCCDLLCHSRQECANSQSCVLKSNLIHTSSDSRLSDNSKRGLNYFAPSSGKETLEISEGKAQKVLGLFTLEDLQTLFIRRKDGSFTSFCDPGVYTRNRNFRIYLSSKLNKNNPLVLAKENIFKPTSEYESHECDVFYASLVSHVGNLKEARILTFDNQGNGRSMQGKTRKCTPKEMSDVRVKSEMLEGWHCSSPYPEADKFLTSLIASNGHSGSIRHWIYFTASETLVFDIAGYRWCGNIRRQHKSNNIMYVMDLRQGVYYQKCYDPECQAVQYRSPEMPLPRHVLPGFYFEDDDTYGNGIPDSGETEDEQLVAAVEDAELLLGLGGN